MRATTVLVVMAVSGCATPPPAVWVQARLEPAPLAQAKADCEFQSEASAGKPGVSFVDMVERSVRLNNLMGLCMKSKGWQIQRG